MSKVKHLLLCLLAAMTLLPGSVSPAHAAVSSYAELVAALKSAAGNTSDSVAIEVSGDIVATDHLVVEGNVTLVATSPATINVDQSQLRVRNGATLTIGENITVSQPASATGHPVYVESSHLVLRGATVTSAATSTSVYTINLNGAGCTMQASNSTVTTVNGRAIYSNITTTPITLENTQLVATGTGYAAYRGVYVLRDGTVLTGNTGGGAIIYDFTQNAVAATPAPATWVGGQLVTLAATGPALPAGTELRYTTDGTDPQTSPTSRVFTEPFAVAAGQTVLATLVRDGFRDSIYTFSYDRDNDTVAGTVASVVSPDPLIKPVGTEINADALGLSAVLPVTLADGRTKYVTVTWDLSAVPAHTTGTWQVVGTLGTVAPVTNPNGVTATATLTIGEAPISGFTLQPAAFLVEGKTSVAKDAVVGTLSAEGGDARTYTYTMAANPLFRIEGDKLVAASALPAGEHTVEMTVTSGSRTETKAFTLAVEPANARFTVANPYEGINWQTAAQLKTAPHTHTIRTNAPEGEWSDGVLGTVKEKLAVYEGIGFDAVAITDHDNVSYPFSAHDAGDSPLVGVPGNELSKHSHTLSYFSTYRDSAGMGPDVSVGMQANFANVAEQGGFLYLAHPSRSGGSTADPAFDLPLYQQHPHLLGLEVLNAGQFTRNHSEDLWDTLLTQTMPQRPIWGTASDDSHSLSLSVTGTGWTVLVADERSSLGARDAMAFGRSYFSSYRVVKGSDDAKQDPGLPAPTISDIKVEQGVIALTTADADTIEWISAEGRVVGTGPSLDVNTAPGADKYVRARMFGPGGQTMTQPFGLFPVDQADTTAPTVSLTDYLPPRVDEGEAWVLPNGLGNDGALTHFAASTLVRPSGEEQFLLDNKVTFDEPGTWRIRYESRDGAGNVGTLERDIIVRPLPTPAPTVTATVTARPTATATVTAQPTPSPRPTPSTALIAPYEVPGFHSINGRLWYTTCEPYSQTFRCRTDIWASRIIHKDGRFVRQTGWVFNNLTYLPYMTRAQWGANPLANTGSWTSTDGRRWRTECDTAATGRGACRSYIWTQVVQGEAGAYRLVGQWVVNNIVRFKP